MEEVEIKTRLNELTKPHTVRLIEQVIAVSANQTDDPIQFLRDMYRNEGLKYDLQPDFFFFYCHDITATIRKSELLHQWEFNAENFHVELSFLGYQLTLERIMVEFGLIKREDTFFAKYEILEVHTDKESSGTIRYGISDIEVSQGKTPEKYVTIRDREGNVLGEAEIFYIDEEE